MVLKVTEMVELVGTQDTFKALKAEVFKISSKKPFTHIVIRAIITIQHLCF